MKSTAPQEIRVRLEHVRHRIHVAARLAGRDPAAIQLLAVSKGASADALRQAHAAGQHAFGENYVQEALDKQAALHDLSDLAWHFIGPIQRNKTQWIANQFGWVHGVDRLLIVERLAHQRQAATPLNVLIQVNISRETSKSGIHPEQCLALAAAILPETRLRLRGLMALPSPDAAVVSTQFQEMAALFKHLQQHYPGETIDTLSMGMSDDLEAAIMAGATLLRIGTAIFGPRTHPRAPSASVPGEKNVQQELE